MGKLILAFFLIITPVYSKVKRPRFNSLITLQKKIFSIEKNILGITSDLDKLEKKLEEKNNSYLENLNQKRVIEDKLAEYRSIIQNEKEQLQHEINSAQESFRAALLTDVDENDYPKNILGRKILKNILKNDLEKFYQ